LMLKDVFVYLSFLNIKELCYDSCSCIKGLKGQTKACFLEHVVETWLLR